MDYKHILSCWHKLEHFSPALLPKDSSVKRLNDLPLDTSVDGKRSKENDPVHDLSGCIFYEFCV